MTGDSIQENGMAPGTDFLFLLSLSVHRVNRFTFGNASRFYEADDFDDSDGWHRRHLRMNRETFDGIAQMVQHLFSIMTEDWLWAEVRKIVFLIDHFRCFKQKRGAQEIVKFSN